MDSAEIVYATVEEIIGKTGKESISIRLFSRSLPLSTRFSRQQGRLGSLKLMSDL